MVISRLCLAKYPRPPLPVASLPMPNELQCQHTSLSSATDLLKLKPYETHRDPPDHHHQPCGQVDQTLPKNQHHHHLRAGERLRGCDESDFSRHEVAHSSKPPSRPLDHKPSPWKALLTEGRNSLARQTVYMKRLPKRSDDNPEPKFSSCLNAVSEIKWSAGTKLMLSLPLSLACQNKCRRTASKSCVPTTAGPAPRLDVTSAPRHWLELVTAVTRDRSPLMLTLLTLPSLTWPTFVHVWNVKAGRFKAKCGYSKSQLIKSIEP